MVALRTKSLSALCLSLLVTIAGTTVLVGCGGENNSGESVEESQNENKTDNDDNDNDDDDDDDDKKGGNDKD